MSSIMSMFAKSPLKPLQEHMQVSHQCAETLLPFLEATKNGDRLAAEKLHDKILYLEKEADTIKRDLRLNLPNGLFLSVRRNDVLTILTLQDHIANLAEDIAGMIMSRDMVFPESVQTDFLKLVARCIDASAQANVAIHELQNVCETGFKGRELDVLSNMIHELDTIEHETDDLQMVVRKDLYTIEKEIAPVDVMFLYKLIQMVGEIADTAERIGGQMQSLVAH